MNGLCQRNNLISNLRFCVGRYGVKDMHVLHGRPQISHADGKTHPHARANCRCNVQSPPAFAALRVMIKKRAAVTAISTFSSRHFCAAFAHELRPIKPRYAGKNLRYVRSYEVPKNETAPHPPPRRLPALSPRQSRHRADNPMICLQSRHRADNPMIVCEIRDVEERRATDTRRLPFRFVLCSVW